jgi:hypothetical protein
MPWVTGDHMTANRLLKAALKQEREGPQKTPTRGSKEMREESDAAADEADNAVLDAFVAAAEELLKKALKRAREGRGTKEMREEASASRGPVDRAMRLKRSKVSTFFPDEAREKVGKAYMEAYERCRRRDIPMDVDAVDVDARLQDFLQKTEQCFKDMSLRKRRLYIGTVLRCFREASDIDCVLDFVTGELDTPAFINAVRKGDSRLARKQVCRLRSADERTVAAECPFPWTR